MIQTVLITGATGAIGCAVVRERCGAGAWHVVATGLIAGQSIRSWWRAASHSCEPCSLRLLRFSAPGTWGRLATGYSAMATYRFDFDYHEIVALHDGSKVLLRLVRPGDGTLIQEGFEHLSHESRLQRFLAPKSKLTESELRYLTNTDGFNHLAIGAINAPNPAGPSGSDGQDRGQQQSAEKGLGVARFIRIRERPEVADVALTVIDEMQHKGLGTLLLERLIEAGRERGVVAFHFDVMAENRPMMAILHDLAPNLHERVASGVASFEIPLDQMALPPVPQAPDSE